MQCLGLVMICRLYVVCDIKAADAKITLFSLKLLSASTFFC